MRHAHDAAVTGQACTQNNPSTQHVMWGTPAGIVLHPYLYPGRCKDQVPLYHDRIRGIARIRAPPKGNRVVPGHFLREKQTR